MISAILQKRHAATKIPRSNPASSHRMSRTPSSIRVVGMHPVIPSPELFNETIEIQWGAGNTSAAAPAAVREHFARLYLIEIEVDSTDAVINWSKITQPVLGQPESNWQVPYAERSVGSGR